jgi:nicotinate-nucleotide adenylyltransferase
LIGGSFDPAHSGHRHIALTALKRLRLDEVWWIVARGNPLKATETAFVRRLQSARDMARHPLMRVIDIEDRQGLTYSIETIGQLQAARPQTCFVWVIGSDNLRTFHRWRDWQGISGQAVIAVVSRPGYPASRASVFSTKLQRFRLPEEMAPALPCLAPPAWVYLRAREHNASSTTIRETQEWP